MPRPPGRGARPPIGRRLDAAPGLDRCPGAGSSPARRGGPRRCARRWDTSSSSRSTQPAAMSSVRVASSGKVRARRLWSRLMARVVCLTWPCKRPATSRSRIMGAGGGRRGGGPLDEGEAGHGLALGVVGGALGEVRLLIILVALGLADGEGHGPVEAAEELLEVGGVLAGGVDADVEVDLRMLCGAIASRRSSQGLVAGAVLDDGERLGGRSAIGPEEGDAVAVAGGVDPDADAVEARRGGHASHPETDRGTQYDECRMGRRESPPRILGQVILVMSGRAARCTNTLSPSRREQSFVRGQSLRDATALPTTLVPVSQTGQNRPYKDASIGTDAPTVVTLPVHCAPKKAPCPKCGKLGRAAGS